MIARKKTQEVLINSYHYFTSYLSSMLIVLKFFSFLKSHSFTTESSADVAK